MTEQADSHVSGKHRGGHAVTAQSGHFPVSASSFLSASRWRKGVRKPIRSNNGRRVLQLTPMLALASEFSRPEAFLLTAQNEGWTWVGTLITYYRVLRLPLPPGQPYDVRYSQRRICFLTKRYMSIQCFFSKIRLRLVALSGRSTSTLSRPSPTCAIVCLIETESGVPGCFLCTVDSPVLRPFSHDTANSSHTLQNDTQLRVLLSSFGMCGSPSVNGDCALGRKLKPWKLRGH